MTILQEAEVPGTDRYLSKKRMVRFFLLFIPAVISILSFSCGRDSGEKSTKDSFNSLRRGSLDLYFQLHPLRTSRIGITCTDSLLFTFSPDELSRQTRRIDSLLTLFSSLPAAALNENDIEESTLMIYWLRGESFALEKLRNHERNPVLYCWMIDEALFGIPSRGGEPGENEFIDYCKRIDQIPILLRNAGAYLKNPAELHVTTAVGRLSDLLDRFSTLEKILLKRYGKLPASITGIRGSISAFRDHLSEEIIPIAHGRHIMGIEDLSDLLKFSEHLDIDLDQFITDAEKSIKQQKSQINSIIKTPLYVLNPANVQETDLENYGLTAGSPIQKDLPETDINAVLSDIEERAGAEHLFDPKGKHTADIIRTSIPALPEDLPVNPYLIIPEYIPGDLTWAVCSPGTDGSPEISILIDPQLEGLDYPQIIFHMINASSPVVNARYSLCAKSRTKRIFASRLYMLGWKTLNLKDLTTLDPDNKLPLRKLYLEKTNLELARMLVVLKLHSGRSTIDASIDFLIEELGMTRDEAEAEVAIASSTPSTGFPGIALTMMANIARKEAAVKRKPDPRKRIRKMMLENAGVPLPLILEKIGD